MSDSETLQFKEMIIEAFREVIINDKELIYNTFFEALEDFHLMEAIKEGESSGRSSREEVFNILKN